MEEFGAKVASLLSKECEVKGINHTVNYDDEMIYFDLMDRDEEWLTVYCSFVDARTTSEQQVAKGLYMEFLGCLY